MLRTPGNPRRIKSGSIFFATDHKEAIPIWIGDDAVYKVVSTLYDGIRQVRDELRRRIEGWVGTILIGKRSF